MTATPLLHTPRLLLRPLGPDCEALYQRFYTDADASRFYSGPLSPAAASARLVSDQQAWALQGFGVWALQQRDSGALVGVCGFWQGRGWPCELTWWLLPGARGQGLAAEASRAALQHAFSGFGWPRVTTYMNDNNLAARALVQRLGGVSLGRHPFPDGLEREMFSFEPAAQA